MLIFAGQLRPNRFIQETLFRQRRPALLFVVLFVLCCVASDADAQQPSERDDSRLFLAHYMPWYVAKPVSRVWGWHWTMNTFDPEKRVDGKRAVASHFYPLIGPYDSGDSNVLEYHLLTMKLAGIDGVIVDWYGLQQFRDYAILNRNTQRLIDQASRLGMKVVICYEDQTIPALVMAGRLKSDKRVAQATSEIKWLTKRWFRLENYVRLKRRPVLLSFGQTGLTNDEWTQCLAGLKSPVAYFSEHLRRSAAVGAFDWPIPTQGLKAIKRFQKTSLKWPYAIPVAFPRFVDIYAQAKVSVSYGRVADNRGETFKTSMTQALQAKTALLQIATWNDWGEGTMIEPSREFGYRDLEVLQQLRRRYLDAQFSATPADLRLPARLLQRRRMSTTAAQSQRCARIATFIATGKLTEARAGLKENRRR